MADLHTHRLQVNPGGTDPDSGAGNNYCFSYAKFASATALNFNTGHPRTIAWAAGHLYTGRKLFVLWSWKPVQGRLPGRVLNFHTHPNFGGWEPDNSTGVSPIALDWFGDQVFGDGASGLVLWAQSEGARLGYGSARYHWTVFTIAEMDAALAAGTWLDIVLEIDIGTYPNGRVQCWAGGSNTPKFDTGQISTQWPSQTAYSLWESIYNSTGLSVVHIADYVPARIGRTLAEALADGVDTPISEVTVIGSVLKTNPAVSNYTHSVIASRTTDQFNLPSSLLVPGGVAPTNAFGKWAVGGTKGTLTADFKRVCKYAADASRDVAEVWAWLRRTDLNLSQTIKAVIYADSAGQPGALLGTSAEVLFSAPKTDGAFTRFTFPTTVAVTSGTSYWIGLISGQTGAATEVAYDVAASFRSLADTYADGAANPFGTPTDSGAREYSFYAVGPTSGLFVPVTIGASASVAATLSLQGASMTAELGSFLDVAAALTVTSGASPFTGKVVWVPTANYVAASRGEFREELANGTIGSVVEWNETTDRWDYV